MWGEHEHFRASDPIRRPLSAGAAGYQAADRVIFMDGRVIIKEGEPEAFFAQPKTERAKAFLQTVQNH